MAVPAAPGEAQKRLSLWRRAAAPSLDMGWIARIAGPLRPQAKVGSQMKADQKG